jgi:hypothetical protein
MELQGRIQALKTSKDYFIRQASDADHELQAVHAEYALLVNKTAPISAFPNEVLAAVFEAGHRLLPESQIPFRLLVSQVCRHWRQVALGSSILWTRVDAVSTTPLELVAEYLQRSKAHGLDLRIVLRGPDAIDDQRILQLVIGHVTRWRHLSIASLSFGSLNVAPKYLHPLAAPILESIEIALDDDMWDFFPDNGTRIFTGGAPSLTYVRVRGNCLRFFMPPLTSLQVLHLQEGYTNTFMPAAEFLAMLRSLPSLKHLILHGYTTDLTADPLRESIKMPSLLTLDIQKAGLPVSFFLYAMSAPLLETLIAGEASQTGYNQFYSLQLPEPYFPTVRTFALRNSEVPEGVYRMWTRVFPSIKYFSIAESSADVFLRHISTMASSASSSSLHTAPPWPELHTIMLSIVGELGLLIGAVADRITMGCPLVKVCLSKTILSRLEIQKCLEWLRERVQIEEIQRDLLEPSAYLAIAFYHHSADPF